MATAARATGDLLLDALGEADRARLLQGSSHLPIEVGKRYALPDEAPSGVLPPGAALAGRPRSVLCSPSDGGNRRSGGRMKDLSLFGWSRMDERENRVMGQGLNSHQTLPGGPGSTPQASAEASTSRSPNPPARSAGSARSTMWAPLAEVSCSTSTRTWSSSASIRRWMSPVFACNPAWRTALLTSSVTARRASWVRPSSAGGGMASSKAARARRPASWCTGRTTSLRWIGRSLRSTMRRKPAQREVSHRSTVQTAAGGDRDR
jgi:hypothetical protein